MIVFVVMAASGCSAKPELQVAGDGQSSVTIVDGRHLLEEGRAVDAVAAFRKQLRLDGDDLRSLNGLAIAYGELGRVDLAAEMFSRALAMAPDDPATLNNVGFAALRRADAELARHYLERARALGGKSYEIEGNLERLALLESFERRPGAGPAIDRAAPALSDRQPTSVRPIAPRTAAIIPITPMPKARAIRSPPDTMIDFMAVIDPFVQGHETK